MKISVAQDFSRFPAGRFREDGPFSGQAFREDHLAPAMRSGESVEVHMDGTEGYGSSFLEESFGGLIHTEGMDKVEIRERLLVETEDEALRMEIWDYIERL